MMTTISSEHPDAAPDRRARRTRLLVPEMWTALAISVIWLVVLVAALFGPDLVSSNAGELHPYPVGDHHRLLRVARHVGDRQARLRPARRRNLRRKVATMSATAPNQPSGPCIVAGFDNSPSGYDAVALARGLADATDDARLIVAYIYSEAVSAIDIVPPPELVAQRRDDALRMVGARASSSTDSSGGSRSSTPRSPPLVACTRSPTARAPS